ncbi:MAG TPA: TolC family protein [Candidatus Paceibacterota bacterium]|nr:TolC family protein [Verrucomicrobiota bacterium]HRY47838.1 TolC family protein [Candidatus Paceibacterota bacterium]HSA02138.1 TolC family protein [Candidatus Paceibacterota bacterium]
MFFGQTRSIRVIYLAGLLGLAGTAPVSAAASQGPPVNWPTNTLSLADCLNLAFTQNSAVLRSQTELDATYGLAIQTKAIVLPKVQIVGNYQAVDEASIDKLKVSDLGAGLNGMPSFSFDYAYQNWSAKIQVVQSLYEGGRMASALRTARLSKDQALASHHAIVADTMLAVRIAYDDVLLAEDQINVQEASVKLLDQELENTTRRFEAGTVPRFNVLRAEVELANARPRLIRARNAYRISKNKLADLLGFRVPQEIWEDLPLQLSGKLGAEPYAVELPSAIARALEQRTELQALRKAQALGDEAVKNAQAGYRPSVQVFGGYGTRNSSFDKDLTYILDGWFAGAQMSWNLFDGLSTKGKIDEARARRRQADVNLDSTTRQIELEVRTAYSNFIEAREVLESQKKVQEQAEEALRLAIARSDAGTGTQLDVLSAQTSLTEARTTQVMALRDYSVARARLERAIGEGLFSAAPPPAPTP